MKEETLTDVTSDYAKMLAVAKAKEGKTTALVANLLGAFPWQKYGAVVDDPGHLHIIALDAGAVVGVREFLTELCGLDAKDVGRVKIYNFQDDVRKVSTCETEWDFDFYNSFYTSCRKIQERIKGSVSAVMVSSLTTLAIALQRSIAGPPGGEKKGGGMDQSKWGELGRQINELRNVLQQDAWHCIWEGHVYQPPATGQNQEEARPETLQVQGASGHNFPNNVEQIFRIRRLFGETHEKSKIDKVYFDTRPAMDFIAGGRLSTTNLEAKEYDLTVSFKRLGLKVGRWGDRSKKQKK